MRNEKRKILFCSSLIFVLCTFGYIKYHDTNINDIGLKIFSWIKKIKGNSVNLNEINNSNTSTLNHEDWHTLLQKNVTDSGSVNYSGFQKNNILFEKYLNDLTLQPPGNNWSDKEKIVYWINAYNAFTVKLVLDHYPIKSIKDIGDGLPMINSPWDLKFFKIGEIQFDLNTIEHEILRKQFNEPRIHFAINCASISCPKLRNEAFVVEQLENQLEDQARQFINNPNKNLIKEEKMLLSKIFNWFASDFKKEKSVIAFIQAYTDITLSENIDIEYLDYDWNLNE